ncbi:MAG: hypothetical protein HC774_01975 [Sphingomonadales bacterium]|nr:hypothetical protein [Sphingomonadales bacterium]
MTLTSGEATWVPIRSVKAKVRALTNRTSQQNPRAVLIRLGQIMRGWAAPPQPSRNFWMVIVNLFVVLLIGAWLVRARLKRRAAQ